MKSSPSHARASSAAASSAAASSTAVRVDIQALRAVAVMLVVLFHLWPNRLTGGFVGVDVFFAISGFLITAHLLREAQGSGRISLPAFWARRARRLLPASLLVLAVSAVATFVWVPQQLWKQWFTEIGASALYVQNWQLASSAVDYLAAENEPSAVQHFWTLSAEEQFYVLWPIVLGVVLLLARRRSATFRSRAMLAALTAIFASSLVYSVIETANNPAAAYFVTPTRVWEFALGGMVAYFWPQPASAPIAVRTVASWLGLVMILAAGVLYSSATPFPGYAAALPVIGALVVVVAGEVPGRLSTLRLARLRPAQFLGDISYSLYLWHWPLIVIAPFALGQESGRLTRLAILVLSVGLAWATKVVVEDPLRFSPRMLARREPRTIFAWSAGAMAVVLALSTIGNVYIDNRAESADRDVANVLSNPPACFGAAAIAVNGDACENPALEGLLYPDPAVAAEDVAPGGKCFNEKGDPTLNMCSYGPKTEAKKTIALIGDSHANQYRMSLAKIAEERVWRVDLIGMSGCYLTASVQAARPEFEADCEQWKDSLNAYLAQEKYDAIVVSYKSGSRVNTEDGQSQGEAAVGGLVQAWRPIADAGTKILAVRDSPMPRTGVVDCVVEHQDQANASCSIKRSKALRRFDAQPAAVREIDGAELINLTDLFCDQERCRPIIGNVVVYRDQGHVTDTYATTLAPYLGKRLVKALR